MAVQRQWVVVASISLTAVGGVGCGDERPLFMEGDVALQGTLALPVVVWPQNPRARLFGDDRHGYLLPGKAGGGIAVAMQVGFCAAIAPSLVLFGPRGDDGQRRTIAASDAASEPCAMETQLHATFPNDGEYLLVVSAEASMGGSYRLDATCERAPCNDPAALTLETTREAHEDEAGAFLFTHVFRVSEGLGNGMLGDVAGLNPRPNMRAVHNGPFGGPDAQSCVSCHNQGGPYSSGSLRANIAQAGDGVHIKSALVRNPPSLVGLGYRQAIAAAITQRLDAQVAVARAAAAGGAPVVATLCLDQPDGSRWPCFGSVVAKPDGSIDTDKLEGIDPDLVVRPFGVKGRESTLYGFIRGGFRVHFGMEAEGPIEAFCGNPPPLLDGEAISPAMLLFRRTWGDPVPSCLDPDHDGIAREVTSFQLRAITAHLAQFPRLGPPPGASSSASAGRDLFAQTGCAVCHVPTLPISVDRLVDEGAELDLKLEPPSGEVEVWSDFKRHDMGALSDVKSFDNAPNVVIAAHAFMTPPLWDVGRSAPYLHDGREPTLHDAIVAHGDARDPDAKEAVQKYEALDAGAQRRLVDFLATLRQPRVGGEGD